MLDEKKSHFFFLYGLALLIVVTFLVTVGMTLFGLTKVDSVLAGTLIGYLSAKCEQVISFYFGSSAGSQRKDELLHQSTPVGVSKNNEAKTAPIECGE